MAQQQTMEEKPGTSREGCNVNEDQKKKRHRKLNEPCKLATHMKDLTLNWGHMVNKMKCWSCHLFPNPELRYLCQAGHHFCHTCWNQLILTNEKGYVQCPGMMSKDDLLRNGPAVMHFRDPNCKKQVRHYPQDPVYTALLTSLHVGCPNAKKGVCSECFLGIEVFDHVAMCRK